MNDTILDEIKVLIDFINMDITNKKHNNNETYLGVYNLG
jgi:hypothetical protein